MGNRTKVTRNLMILICLLLLFQPASGARARDDLVLVTIPWQSAAALNKIYAPMVELLGRRLGKTVRLTIAESYQEVGEHLNHRTADIGILGGNAYVEAKESYPDLIYLATCKQPDAFYHSAIIVHKTSEIQTVFDLTGRSFAYTDVKSTSGYVYPRLMLFDEGLDPDYLFSRTYFLSKHDKVYDAVGKRVVDAGGVSVTPWEKSVQRNGDVYRVIAQSEPIPRNAVVAGAHIAQSLVDRLRAILSQAENDPAFGSSGSLLKGFLVRDDHFYDIVRKARTLR